jgi:hypothetical protein
MDGPADIVDRTAMEKKLMSDDGAPFGERWTFFCLGRRAGTWKQRACSTGDCFACWWFPGWCENEAGRFGGLNRIYPSETTEERRSSK